MSSSAGDIIAEPLSGAGRGLKAGAIGGGMALGALFLAIGAFAFGGIAMALGAGLLWGVAIGAIGALAGGIVGGASGAFTGGQWGMIGGAFIGVAKGVSSFFTSLFNAREPEKIIENASPKIEAGKAVLQEKQAILENLKAQRMQNIHEVADPNAKGGYVDGLNAVQQKGLPERVML